MIPTGHVSRGPLQRRNATIHVVVGSTAVPKAPLTHSTDTLFPLFARGKSLKAPRIPLNQADASATRSKQ
jgi:hypothetical protein